MKRKLLAILCITFFQSFLPAQSFFNGSFESHVFTVCTRTIADVQFNNNKIGHVRAFGRTFVSGYGNVGEVSVQDSGCSVVPIHGKWCLGLHSAFNGSSDAVALELTSALTAGSAYQLSFSYHGNVGFQNLQSPINIGESLSDFTVGNFIYSVTPVYLSWTTVTFTFTASQASRYITAKMVPGYNSWAQIDNFVLTPYPAPVGIEEQELSGFLRVYPNPAGNDLQIHFANDPEPCLVELFNQLGQPVIQKRLVQSQGSSIDVSEVPSGLYYLTVSNSTSTVRKRVIIAH